MLELEAGRARFFNGTWHNWRREQAAREMALGKAIEKQQAEIARMERFIERFRYKASKARQAQSRVKKLDKIERITRDPKDGRALAFSFKPPERSGRVIFELDDGRLEVPGKVLLDDAELWLERGEHVSLVGPNGTGKTTLLEALAGAPRARRRQAAQRPQRQGRLPQPAHRGARARAARGRCSRPARGAPGCRRTRRARCSGASCSAARRPRSRSTA